MPLRTPLLALLLVCAIVNARKPLERTQKLREEGGKDVSWFKVDEGASESCKDVIESDHTVVTGPPASECTADAEKFCFCGKKGSRETADWKYLCGECRQNEPFSFKIEKPGGRGKGGKSGRQAVCSDEARPACADGSRPQKPEEAGQPPVCEDGNNPVCSDGAAPSRPSPCQDGSQPKCGDADPVCGDGSALRDFGPPCTKDQGKPKCAVETVEPLCEDGSKPKGPGKGKKGGRGGGRGGRGGGRGGGRAQN